MKAIRLIVVMTGLLLGSVVSMAKGGGNLPLDPIVEPMWGWSYGSWNTFGPSNVGLGRSIVGYGDLPWENDSRGYSEAKLLNGGITYNICAQVTSYTVGGNHAGSTGLVCRSTAATTSVARAETGSYFPGCGAKTHVVNGYHTISRDGSTWSTSTSQSVVLSNSGC